MRVAIAPAYGGPEVMKVEERPRPHPRPDEVLVRVDAAALGAADSAMRLGDPAIVRLFFGFRKPRQPVLGTDFAGEVVEVGSEVSDIAIGDRIFGAAVAAHAEYLTVSAAGSVAALPANVSASTAVALVDGGMTALPFLRDTGRLKPGQRLLVNGASGSVGSAAVQLGRHLGAIVTAVTSTPNVELVRELGAHEVIDYLVNDFTQSDQRWDVVFDAVGMSSFGKARRVLTPEGIYLSTVPGAIVFQSLFSKRAAISFTGLRSHAAKRPDLVELANLASRGEFAPVIDSEYSFDDIVAAHIRVDSKRKRGTVVVKPQQ